MESRQRQLITEALMLSLMTDSVSKLTLVFFGTFRGQVLPYPGNITELFFLPLSVCFVLCWFIQSSSGKQ